MKKIRSFSGVSHIKTLMIAMSLWALYAFLYIKFKDDSHPIVSGIFSLVGESGLDFVLCILSYSAWNRASLEIKKFFMFMFFAFLSAFISDLIYNYLLNIKNVKLNSFMDALFDVPFALSLLFYTIAWGSLFFNAGSGAIKEAKNYIPYVLASIVIFFTFVFGINWKIEYFSLIGWCQIIDTFLEALGFLFASFCFVRAKKIWVKYISVGYLLVIGADFVIRYGVIENNIVLDNPLETMWVLGLILMTLGFFFINKNARDNSVLLMGINTLQAQSAIWFFALSLGSAFLFSIIYFSVEYIELGFKPFNLKGIPSIIIIFSIISALVSNIISSFISKPFYEIRKIVALFNKEEYENTEVKLNTNIDEFKELESFLLDSLVMKNERFKVEEAAAKNARQVAHDIKSPLLALNVLARDTQLSDKKHKMLIDSIVSIDEIASSLLDQYCQHKINADRINISKPYELLPLIVKVVNERSISLDGRSISMRIDVDEKDKYVSANVNPVMFKRVILNLINNSIESMESSGSVDIVLRVTSNFLRIEVKDDGCGIPEAVQKNIFTEGVTYGKENGSGLGLHFVTMCIDSWGGNYDIYSKVNEGTTFGFTLPVVNLSKHIVLLDDSVSVTMSWELEAERYGYQLNAFNNIEKFMKYMEVCDKTAEVYVDSDLKVKKTGLAVLKKLHEKGFRNLYLQTGSDPEQYRDFLWLKGVLGKNPPFSWGNNV
jgi:signal transduction histidine kinase